MNNEIVSAEWLKNNFTRDEIVILDSSPHTTINGNVSPYSKLCIPNSRVFEIKENFIDKQSKFPNTIPSALQFEQACQTLGINANSEIVVYDNLGIYTSPRVWWLFKVMGHKNIKVLDGGLVEWINQGYETINKENLGQDYTVGNFKSDFQAEYLINYEDVVDNLESKKFLIVDARSKGRFDGTEPEPRKYLKSGSITNSVNIPYTKLLENGMFKSKKELSKIFNTQINNDSKLVFSCGSGMTACIVMLASEIAFRKSSYLYDGSWTEYAEMRNLKENVGSGEQDQ